jgi:hypothetical protein
MTEDEEWIVAVAQTKPYEFTCLNVFETELQALSFALDWLAENYKGEAHRLDARHWALPSTHQPPSTRRLVIMKVD